MILYAVAALTPKGDPSRAVTISVGLYALHNVVYAAISYPAGALAERINKRVLLALGYSTGAATALLLALNISGFPALVAVFVLGRSCVGMEETLEDSLAAELLPDAIRGTGFGTMALINGLGDFISNTCVGWLWAVFGARVGFGFAVVLMTVGIVVVWTMRYPIQSEPG